MNEIEKDHKSFAIQMSRELGAIDSRLKNIEGIVEYIRDSQKELNTLKTEVGVLNTKAGFISGFISLIVSAVTAFLVKHVFEK